MTAIAKSASQEVVESLNLPGMMGNRRLAGALADAGLSGALCKLEYECLWYCAD